MERFDAARLRRFDARRRRLTGGIRVGARGEEQQQQQQEELRGRLPPGRRVVVGVQDPGGAGREGEDAPAEPRRDHQGREVVGAVQGHRGLLRSHRQGRRVSLALEREHHQRHPLLPHSGTELCFQRLFQGSVQLQARQGRIPEVVRREHRVRQRRRRDVPAVRLLPGLREDTSYQRLQVCREQAGRRAAVHGPRRRLPQDAPFRRRRGSLPRVQRLLRGHHRLPRPLLRDVRLLQAAAPHGGPAGQLLREPGAGLDDHHGRQPGVVPAGHRPEEDDDDLRRGCQVQELRGCVFSDRQERGRQVAVQRRRRQCAPCHRRRRRARGIRQAAGRLLREQVWRVRCRCIDRSRYSRAYVLVDDDDKE